MLLELPAELRARVVGMAAAPDGGVSAMLDKRSLRLVCKTLKADVARACVGALGAHAAADRLLPDDGGDEDMAAATRIQLGLRIASADRQAMRAWRQLAKGAGGGATKRPWAGIPVPGRHRARRLKIDPHAGRRM